MAKFNKYWGLVALGAATAAAAGAAAAVVLKKKPRRAAEFEDDFDEDFDIPEDSKEEEKRKHRRILPPGKRLLKIQKKPLMSRLRMPMKKQKIRLRTLNDSEIKRGLYPPVLPGTQPSFCM